MKEARVNDVILSSIPLNRKMKRYWISKYKRIANNCGTDEAVRKFKQLRVAVLSYLSDPCRKSNLDKYLSLAGFRTNGYLRMLFEYADTQPHYVLSFLKLYSATTESTRTLDQCAGDVKNRLSRVRSQSVTPKYLRSWLQLVTAVSKRRTFKEALRSEKHPYHKLAHTLGYKEWCNYWWGWFDDLKKGWSSGKASPEEKLVFPEIYKDYDPKSMHSDSFESDFADLISFHYSLFTPFGEEVSPLKSEELDFIDSFLSEEIADSLDQVLSGGETPYLDVFAGSTVLSGTYVGHVQHIHKKGGGTDMRDIAVPNRFIQQALAPGAYRLYQVVRYLRKDATFNQEKFDTLIQNRVNNSNLYQGSVDLSKATDNLPASWGFEIIHHLQDVFYPDADFDLIEAVLGKDMSSLKEERKSLSLFETVARAPWEDEGYMIKWKVGQPLGSLPSFAMLAITHNLLLEAMSATLGLKHSPYCVLGDDVVIFNRKLRRKYISELTSRAIPLSLHKSYVGRLSEFAGKTYVKGSVPFHCSDHSLITWASLFDWQRATGIRIPWSNLPRSIRRRIERLASEMTEKYKVKAPHLDVQPKLASSSYALAQSCEVLGAGSRIYPLPTDSESEESKRMVEYFMFREEMKDNQIPDAYTHTGITMVGNGHPVILMNERYADHDGYFHRFRPVELPSWYKDKYRPCASDSAIKAALAALLERASKQPMEK